MNRAQNTSWYTVCSEHSRQKWDCQVLHVNALKSPGWVLNTKNLVFDSTGNAAKKAALGTHSADISTVSDSLRICL
jgi:hypothetical protein